MGRLTGEQLYERTLAGLAPELELFGSSSSSGEFLRLPGLVAAISPATPDRSLFNSAYAFEPGAWATAYEDLDDRYARAGVRAWTAWIRESDREAAALLAGTGHVLDAAPRAMALELDDLLAPARPLPEGVELTDGDLFEAGRLNDRAYEIAGAGWGTALTRAPQLAATWRQAVRDGTAVACACVIDNDDDACVTGVATVPDQRGLGLASHIVYDLLRGAKGRGVRTASLQASAAGAPVYARLGFRDVGGIEMWEKRQEP